jgi:small neutral amino acid transporter SnatA (MarC family)
VAAKGALSRPSANQVVSSSNQNIVVFSLGFPYLAGPGTILTTIILKHTNGNFLTALTVILEYLSILPILYRS